LQLECKVCFDMVKKLDFREHVLTNHPEALLCKANKRCKHVADTISEQLEHYKDDHGLGLKHNCPVVKCGSRFYLHSDALEHHRSVHYWPCEVCWKFETVSEELLKEHVLGGCLPRMDSIQAFSLRFDDFLKRLNITAVIDVKQEEVIFDFSDEEEVDPLVSCVSCDEQMLLDGDL
jgi:hypothetical protein